MAEHDQKQPAPPIEVEPSLPQPRSNAILTAMEKDPSRRFLSADQFRQVLLQVRKEPDGSGPRSGRIRAAARVLILTAGLVQGGSTGAHIAPGGRPPAQPSEQSLGSARAAPAGQCRGSKCRQLRPTPEPQR